MCIRTLTKAELCLIFGEYSRSSLKKYTANLRTKYFTDEALESLNITLERYYQVGNGRAFTYAETIRIIEYFQITTDELEEIYT